MPISNVKALLQDGFAHGRMTLFTGAGFSSEAFDQQGRRVPLGEALAAELFELCFPGERRDDSTLPDLFQHALARHPDELQALLRRRLVVQPESLPPHYERWFSLPWRRIWTLNVDDLVEAAARRFQLPRRIEVLSALDENARIHEPDPDVLQIIHLNGHVAGGPSSVTFATMQYGERLARNDPFYRALVADLAKDPFLFVGTKLDEAPFWQNAELGGLAPPRPRSFLVATRITRARERLLELLDIHWIEGSTESFAREVLAAL